jgi:hypothetical protein
LRGLGAQDFAYDNPTANGLEELWTICEELRGRSAVMEVADDIFDLMERLDDVDLGSPGPLVHALESTGTAYEPNLQASVRRRPAPLSVWMVNRILNTDRADRRSWLDLMAMAAAHPLASEATRADARGFLAFQAGRAHV